MPRYKFESTTTTLEAAISDFYSLTEDLANEIREIVDNAEGGLANTQRIQTLDETATALEEVAGDTKDLPEGVDGAIEIHVGQQVRTGKRRGAESRAIRASNIASHAQTAAQELRDQAERLEEEAKELEDGSEAQVDKEALAGELTELADFLEEQASTVEDAEFPGMFG